MESVEEEGVNNRGVEVEDQIKRFDAVEREL